MEDALTLQPGGPLGARYVRFLLDEGYTIGSSTGERVSLTGQWGAAPNNQPPASPYHDAEDGTEYWYIEAFRIPPGFAVDPRFTIVSEWHANSANRNRPIYMIAPWRFRISSLRGVPHFQVRMATGLQFGDRVNRWEISGWNPAWGPTTPSPLPRVPTTNTRGTPAPEGNPLWLAPVSFGKWQYFLYRIKWSNDWNGIFECWTRTEQDTNWTKVASYHRFPTHVYQIGDTNTNHYAIAAYYRGEGGTRQYLDYGGRARSNSVIDAELGAASTGFRELAALATLGGEGEPSPDDETPPDDDETEPGDGEAEPPGEGGEEPDSGVPGPEPSVPGDGLPSARARFSGVRVPQRGRLTVRVRSKSSARVQVVVRGPHGWKLARKAQTITRRHSLPYRLRLRGYRGQRVLSVHLKSRTELRFTHARMRLGLSRNGERIIRKRTRIVRDACQAEPGGRWRPCAAGDL